MMLKKEGVLKAATVAAQRPIRAKSPVEIRIGVLIQRKDEAARTGNRKDHLHAGVRKRKKTGPGPQKKKRSTKNLRIRSEIVPVVKIKNLIMNRVLGLMKTDMDNLMNLMFPFCLQVLETCWGTFFF